MLDRAKAAQILELVEIDVPVVDLVAALAQEIADHVLAWSFGAAGRGNGDEIPCGRKLRLEAGIDGVENSFLDIAGHHFSDCFLLPSDQSIDLTRVQACFQNRIRAPTLRPTHARAAHRQGSNMKVFRASLAAILTSGLLLIGLAQIWPVRAQYVGREQDIVNLRLGQRVLVDDGTCPAGQVKEVSGTKMTSGGIVAARKCIPRVKPKSKDVH
jgi:hypothetical protein